MLFKAVVYAVLIFGLETCVPNPRMGQALGSFQHGVERRITGRQTNRQEERDWEYPTLAAAMEEAGIEEIGAYILKRQNTVAHYITMRPIMDLCKNTVLHYSQRWSLVSDDSSYV